MLRLTLTTLSLLLLFSKSWAGSVDNSASRAYVDFAVSSGTSIITGSVRTTSIVILPSLGYCGLLPSNPPVFNYPAIDMQGGSLYDDRGAESLHWSDRVLEDTNSQIVVDWRSQALFTPSGGLSLNWRYRLLQGDWTNTANLVIASNITARTLQQTEGGWEDLTFPANTISTFAAADVTALAASNALVFAVTCTTNLSTGDHGWTTTQMPHGWVTNTHIRPHIHFVQENADQTNTWFMRYKWYNIGDAVPATWTELDTSSNVMAYASGAIHQVAAFPDIDGTHGMSSIMDFKIYRKGATGTGAIMLKQFDIHYRREAFGSRQENTK